MRQTTESIQLRLTSTRSNIKVLGVYKNSREPLLCTCLKCKHKWSPCWSSLQQGHGCPKCGGCKKLSSAEIQTHLEKTNSNITVLGKYVSNKVPVKCKCKVCGHVWSSRWNALSKGVGCPKCAWVRVGKSFKLTHDEVIQRLQHLSPSILILGKYMDCRTKMKCECRVCKHKWQANWMALSQGHGCPKCGGQLKLTTAEVKQRMAKINPNIAILGKYTGCFAPLKCGCKNCKHIWRPKWSDLNKGTGCPQCSAGKFEEEVRSIIEKLTGSKFPRANPSEVPFLHGLHLDGYDRINKRAFEADGEQHIGVVSRFHGRRNPYLGFLQQKRRDWRKNIQCWRYGVKLMRIPYRIKDLESYITVKLRKFGWLPDEGTQKFS